MAAWPIILTGLGNSSGADGADSFRDCPSCPEMVVVAAGSFAMGADDAYIAHLTGLMNLHDPDPDRVISTAPRQQVRIGARIAIGRHEVSFDEWDRCVAAGGCRHRADDHGWGRGARPVIDVSWHDTQDYIGWLSAMTGQDYRLPSEAEWEYAARAGTETRRWWGDDIGVANANCTDCGIPGDDRRTMPVGSFAANPFGLHDVLGNVWELVEDCWHDNYIGAPDDGGAWTTGADCDWRVMRGGSWSTHSGDVLSFYRVIIAGNRHENEVGFRVARDID